MAHAPPVRTRRDTLITAALALAVPWSLSTADSDLSEKAPDRQTVCDGSDDPILAAIATHGAACAALEAAPSFAAYGIACDAFDRMIATTSTTLAGCIALRDYVGQFAADDWSCDWEDEVRYTLRNALAKIGHHQKQKGEKRLAKLASDILGEN